MKYPPITFYAAKRNGDHGQEFGVAYAIIVLPAGYGPAAIDQYTTMCETEKHSWIEIDLICGSLPNTLQYFQARVDMGWFIQVDDPYSQESILWRLTSDSEEKQ